MTYYELYELCKQYGLRVDYNVTGKWRAEDNSPGAGYRIYVWDVTTSNSGHGWPIRVLGRIGLDDLFRMTYSEMEDLVVRCSLEAISGES